MRVLVGGLSLVGLLIAVAITMFLWAKDAQTVGDAKKKTEGPINQIAGRDEGGKDVLESITLSPGLAGGHLRSLDVTAIVAGGAMEKMYGLKAGDQIMEAGDYDIRTADDFETGRIMFVDRGYKPGNALKVRRDGKEIVLTATHSPQNELNPFANPGGR